MCSAIRAVPTNQAEGAIMTLSGKNVVVLGGSRGVGRRIPDSGVAQARFIF
jgi:hypothetical protein